MQYGEEKKHNCLLKTQIFLVILLAHIHVKEIREEMVGTKIIVHSLKYYRDVEFTPEVYVHNLSYSTSVEGDFRTIVINYDIEIRNIPDEVGWIFYAFYDWSWDSKTVEEFEITKGNGEKRISGKYTKTGRIDIVLGLNRVEFYITYGGTAIKIMEVYAWDMPVSGKEYVGEKVVAGNANVDYDFEIVSLGDAKRIRIVWDIDGGPIIAEYTSLGRYTGTWTKDYGLYGLRFYRVFDHDEMVDFFYISAEEFPYIIDKQYEAGVEYPLVTYNIEILYIEPYSKISLIWLDSPDHGYVIAEWASTGEYKDTVSLTHPLYGIQIIGDSTILAEYISFPVIDKHIEVPPPSVTIVAVGKVTAGYPPPNMTLKIVENTTILTEKTFPSVPVGETRQVTYKDERKGTHTVYAIMTLENPVGTATYKSKTVTYTI